MTDAIGVVLVVGGKSASAVLHHLILAVIAIDGDQRQTRHLKQATGSQLVALGDELDNLLQAQLFYHEAMLALMDAGDDPEHWLIGAILAKRWLRESGENLRQQLRAIRSGLS